jgi:hypothetical protein
MTGYRHTLHLLPPEHPAWNAEEIVPPQLQRPLLGIDYGCRTCVIYAPPTDLDPDAAGMPSLSCIAGNTTGLPMFSSNLALAAALVGAHLDEAGRQAISQGMLAKQARWRDRLALWGKA